MPIPLSDDVWQTPPPTVQSAGYDRTKVVPRILHLGFGNFHRAHLARYADRLLEQGCGDWGICGVGTTPQDAYMHQAMSTQSCLYTLVERDESVTSARVIGSVVKYIFGPREPEAVFQQMADPQTQIVSLTATESGYYVHSGTGELMLDHENVRHDLQHPNNPRTIFGYLAEGLDRRRKAGTSALTVLSCDNLVKNGKVAHGSLLSFCRAAGRTALAAWIEDHVTFPVSMVDRITLSTTDAMRAYIRETYGIDDAYPVFSERFTQWVIEDKFCNGRPAWERVDVLFTSKVAPWEKTKIYILNASHSAMGYLGYLCGFRYIHEIAQAPLFALYLARMLDIEVTPLLPVVPGLDIGSYKASVLARFANPTIGDTALRICQDGSAKLPKFVLPSITKQLRRGGPIRKLSLCIAAWLRFLNGVDEQGNDIPIFDPLSAKLQALAREHRANPRPFLELIDVFGPLGQSDRFVQELQLMLTMLYESGAAETLKFVLQG